MLSGENRVLPRYQSEKIKILKKYFSQVGVEPTSVVSKNMNFSLEYIDNVLIHFDLVTKYLINRDVNELGSHSREY